MCGILAIAGAPISDSDLQKGLDTLSHRGPDDHGTMVFPDATLGQTRLAIIDLSPGGHQPKKDNEKDIAITFNGEIYNYKELRKTLEGLGHHFSSQSDTEVILKAYRQYGRNCPKYLDGMFAIIIWDNEKKELFLARDRFGKKPLYYTISGNTLYAASEIKALTALGVVPELSLEAVDLYLYLGYIPPWRSIYTNINHLPPAHSLTFKDGAISIERYWKLVLQQPIAISYEEAREEVSRLLEQAVEKRMLAADVEVGALLSGGVDSTIVSILAQEHLNHPLKTFSLGYGTYINELPFADQAAKAIGSEHYTLQANANMVDELRNVIAYFDEPHADNSDFPQHLVSELASRKVKVALSGDGGDELFMGYGWHTRHRHLSYKAHTYEKLLLNPFKGRVRATRIFKPLERIALWGTISHLSNDIYMEDAYDPSLTSMQKINVFDLTTYLPGQLLSKVDRTGMMHGLEVRSPLLDTALTEFVCNLPEEYKIGPEGQKRILKDILARYMPHDFVYRRKQGFGAPITKWLRTKEMATFTQITLGKGARIRSLLHGRVIDFLLRDFYEREHDRADLRLWTLLCLELWLDTRNN